MITGELVVRHPIEVLDENIHSYSIYQFVHFRMTNGDPMKTKDLITEVISLPVEERAIVVDSLLKSLNPPESDIDQKWAAVAKRRLKELRSGEVAAIPGDEVFKKIWQRFSS